MCAKPETIPSETFIIELRNALNHLYDPDFLRASPLAVLLGVSGRFDTPSALQGILTRAIEALKPIPNASNKTHARSIYDLLLFRYVQQFNQNEIANQLGISVRHLRRQQNLAIYELAGRLWTLYQLSSASIEEEQSQAASSLPTEPDHLDEELIWLKQPSIQAATDLQIALEAVRLLIQPFVAQQETRLVFPIPAAGLAQVHTVAFQQIILSLLTFIIQTAPGQEVKVDIIENQGWHFVIITTQLTTALNLPVLAGQEALDSVRKMVEMSEGTISFDTMGKLFRIQVSFRSINPVKVLVIDDNPEIITMLQRFSADTRYKIIGLNDPNEAVETALQILPTVIMIDIMMPQIDGLQVLSRLKHHPLLGKIPVVICSVLPQQNLAASLGAKDFIQKPIKRESFITAIDQAAELA